MAASEHASKVPRETYSSFALGNTNIHTQRPVVKFSQLITLFEKIPYKTVWTILKNFFTDVVIGFKRKRLISTRTSKWKSNICYNYFSIIR